MALKDWKKTITREKMRTYVGERKFTVYTYTKKANQIKIIIPDRPIVSYTLLVVQGIVVYINDNKKIFETKSQALAYAKAYMKKH